MDFERSILMQADDFYEVYQRCLEGKNPRGEGSTTVYSIVAVPAIVNAAFACELYFKCLTGKERQSHNLLGFYNALPKEIRSEIDNSYKQYARDELDTARKAIDYVKKAFVEWRYLYKEDNVCQSNPARLNEFLRIFKILVPLLKRSAYKAAHSKETGF
jgi:hypothetical protein